MRERSFFPIVLILGLLLTACTAGTAPAIPTTPPTVLPVSSATPTAGPSTIRGEFVLTNTSSPGMEVGVETMAIILEHRLSADGSWEEVITNCTFDPPAPLVLKEQLVIQYECIYLKEPPPNAELHTTAEITIFGSDQVFKLEVNSP